MRSNRTLLRQHSKGQLFTIDFIIGLLITLSAIVTAVVLIPQHDVPFIQDKERLDTLMSEGVPENWTETSVIRVGFLSDGRFNTTKIDRFAALDAADQQQLLGIASNFTIRFMQNGSYIDLCTTCGFPPVNYNSLAHVQRHAPLGDNITTMEVRLYE